MTYAELKKIFTDFHTGKITKKELCFAICMHQEKTYNKVADYPEWMKIIMKIANTFTNYLPSLFCLPFGALYVFQNKEQAESFVSNNIRPMEVKP